MDSTNSTNGLEQTQAETSWQSEYLREQLRNGVVIVRFIKKDGSERTLRGTLQPSLLPQQTDIEEAVSKTPNTNVLAVWDLDNEGWRSFRFDSIIGFVVEP